MTSLCTLGYFDLSINSIDDVQSGELTNLRYLRLTCSTVPSHLKSKMDDMGSILAKLSNLRSVTLEPSSILGDGPSSMSICCDGLSSVSSPPALLQRFEWLPCICTFPSIPKWIGHLNKLCILKIGVRELASNDVDILRGLPALTVLSLYVRLKPSERIVFTKTGFSVLKVFKFRCSVPWLEFEVDAMPNLLKLKLGFDAHGVDQRCTIPAGIVHLIGLKEISAKIGVAGARDPDRRAAESGLIDAIKMHPACPTFNIQCLDGMFGGKDDNNSRVQEEEVEHMTLQKQYDIMEEDSIEQHVVLQKDTREDAGSRWEDSAPSSRPCGSIDDQSLGCKSGQSFLKFDSHDLLNYTAPCKMPKIKNLFDACKVSFTPDGPISDEALERVRALLDEIRPLDLGLDKEAKIARNWNSSTRQQKGRRARDGPNQYASPIKYLHIPECESFSMGIFCMPPSSVTPLHNHPAMTVLSKLLYGKLHTESYDWIDVADPADPLKRAARPARCLRDREVTAPETTILYPDRGGNIHTFRAITPCALVDILCPPYSAENGRDCSYFRKSSVRGPSVILLSDIDSSEVVWLEKLEDHQPPEGFVVARGLYKGPAIKGDS